MKPAHLIVPALFLFATTALAELPDHDPVPGGVALVELDGDADDLREVRYRDRPALVVRDKDRPVAILGIALDADTGTHEFRTIAEDGESRVHEFEVGDRDYGESRITIEDERMVTPAEEDLDRIAEDREEINAAIAHRSERSPETLSFELPIEDVETSPFGRQRYINDEPRNPHSGTDIRGDEDTAIYAPAPGEVIETGDYYFNGKTVFVDHGSGLISMFAHMSRIDVEPGQEVDTGTELGRAGSTGRVTGPHLHWTVALNGALVNPRLFVADESPLEGDDKAEEDSQESEGSTDAHP